MLKRLQEFGEYVEITAFSNVEIEDIEGFLKATREELQGAAVQFFNAELVATWQHLFFAVVNALTAFRNKNNISKNLAVEVMLYATAQRQIRKAIALAGFKRESANVAVVIIGGNSDAVKTALAAVSKRIGAEVDETVLALSDAKMKNIRGAFGISDKEMGTVTEASDAQRALVSLIIERMALLATQL